MNIRITWWPSIDESLQDLKHPANDYVVLKSLSTFGIKTSFSQIYPNLLKYCLMLKFVSFSTYSESFLFQGMLEVSNDKN